MSVTASSPVPLHDVTLTADASPLVKRRLTKERWIHCLGAAGQSSHAFDDNASRVLRRRGRFQRACTSNNHCSAGARQREGSFFDHAKEGNNDAQAAAGRSTSHAASTIRKDVVRRACSFLPPVSPKRFRLTSCFPAGRATALLRTRFLLLSLSRSLRCRSWLGSRAFLATTTSKGNKKTFRGGG